MINLKEKPFYLNDDDIKWVNNTLCSMSVEDKLHHLFCLVAYNDSEDYCKYIAQDIRPGGFMSRVMPLEECAGSGFKQIG